MPQQSSNRIHANVPLLILVSSMLMAQPSCNAIADDLLGLYLGGAIGQSHVVATGQTTYTLGNVYYDTGSFKENHSAFKGMVGIRPISLLGAEVDYTDFGHPNGAFNAYPADVSMRGVSAFGVLYLPVPIVSVFLKAGVARIQSRLSGTGSVGPNCSASELCPEYIFTSSFQLNRTNTSGAGGLRAQYRFGAWAVRVEYERFNAAGGNPSLVSAGVTWTFL